MDKIELLGFRLLVMNLKSTRIFPPKFLRYYVKFVTDSNTLNGADFGEGTYSSRKKKR